MDTPQEDSIRILGRDYSVVYVPPSGFSQVELGLCDNKTQTLSIASDQTPIEAADTLLHEVIHAIDWIVGLELSEHQVRHLSATLVGVLQDNPEFAQWLIQDKTWERKQYEQKSRRKRTKRTPPDAGKSPQGTTTDQGRNRKGQFSYPKCH